MTFAQQSWGAHERSRLPNSSVTHLNKSIAHSVLSVLPPLQNPTSPLHTLNHNLSTTENPQTRAPLAMSEAPRVEISQPVFPDLDPSAPSNRDSLEHSSELPHTNGNANGSLTQSAQKAGNSILESEVRVTERPRCCRDPANGIHRSLICTSHTTESPL
jgi:hypothetical protein